MISREATYFIHLLVPIETSCWRRAGGAWSAAARPCRQAALVSALSAHHRTPLALLRVPGLRKLYKFENKELLV